jgi:hypothetical protein
MKKKKRVKLHITCGTDDCPNFCRTINIITFEPDEDPNFFFENYGHGSEDQSDYCFKCGNLGILEDPE